SKAEIVDQLGGSNEVMTNLEVVGVAQDVNEAAVPVLLESRGAKRSRFGWDPVDDNSYQSLRRLDRDRQAVAKMIHHRQGDVAGEQVASALNSPHALSDDLSRHPLLDV